MWRRLLACELEEDQKTFMSRLDRDINFHITISCHDQKFIFQLDSLFLLLICPQYLTICFYHAFASQILLFFSK